MTIGRPRFIPFFAEDANYPAGTDPWSGTPTKVDPGLATRNAGFTPATKPPAEWFNWASNAIGKWIDYLADLAFMNWSYVITKDAAGASFDTNQDRKDGGGVVTSPAKSFYDETSGLWVLTGSNTADNVYVGTEGLFNPGALSATGKKYQFGCCMNSTNGFVIFCNDVAAPGGTSQFISYNLVTATANASNIGSCVTRQQACDCVVTPTGRIVVCGGRDGQQCIWYSDNQAASWSRIDIAAQTNTSHNLDHIILGKNGMLIAWTQATTANGGDKLYYSTDNGATWSTRTGIGFDVVRDGVYLSDQDTYVFMRLNEFQRTAEITAGAFASLAIPCVANGAFCIGSFGDALLFLGLDGAPGLGYKHTLFLSWNLGSTWRPVKVFNTMTMPGIFINSFGETLITNHVSARFSLAVSGMGAAARTE